MAGLTVTHCLFERSCSSDDTCMQLPCQCQRQCVQHRWARTLVNCIRLCAATPVFFTIPKRQSTERFQKRFFILIFLFKSLLHVGQNNVLRRLSFGSITMHTKKWKTKEHVTPEKETHQLSHQTKKHITPRMRQRNTQHLTLDKETHHTRQKNTSHLKWDKETQHLIPDQETHHTRLANKSHTTSEKRRKVRAADLMGMM